MVPPGPFFGFHLRFCGLILCGLRVIALLSAGAENMGKSAKCPCGMPSSLKSLLGPDFLHLQVFKITCGMSSRKHPGHPKKPRVWHQQQHKNQDSERDSAAFFVRGRVYSPVWQQDGEKGSERESWRMQISQSQVSLCLSVYPLM